jgi:16S rRNA C967 or C1407 C5-methylase (RsmB/RsmF family)
LLSTYFKDGLLVANEVIKTRAAVLVENITKWGTTPVVVTNNDPVHFQSLPAYFDVMMVDAPCSGSGLFRKDPSAIAEWSEDNVQLCSQRQQRILADVLPALKQDGLLLYSTCSYSVEEDEAIADWLVDEMGMESVQLQLPAAWAIVETNSPRHQAKGYRFYPDKIKGEGFFISVFRQKKDIVGAGKKQK